MRHIGRDPIEARQYERFLSETKQKAKEVINLERVDMDDFVDLYGAASVDEDRQKVEALRKKFLDRETSEQKRTKDFATMFEGLILEQIDQSMWFGASVTTVAASEYDDYINGVDVIANIDVDGKARSTMGLGIDVTFATYPRKKIDRILESIRDRKPTSIKYFNNGDVRGELKQVPRIVLAVEARNVEALAKIWIQEKNGLAKHPIVLQLADQIFKQLEVYYGYASRMLGEDDTITDMYKRQYVLWGNILESLELEELEHDPRASTFLDNDAAHSGLMNMLSNI